jgi:hypothetical protein
MSFWGDGVGWVVGEKRGVVDEGVSVVVRESCPQVPSGGRKKTSKKEVGSYELPKILPPSSSSPLSETA